MVFLIISERPGLCKMPHAIERSVVRQNVKFMHSRSQFSPEYFQFLKKLIMANHNFVLSPAQDEVSIYTFKKLFLIVSLLLFIWFIVFWRNSQIHSCCFYKFTKKIK